MHIRLEIVSFPIKQMVIFHSSVGLPKGTYGDGSHPKDEPSGSRGHPRSHGTAMRDHRQGRAPACRREWDWPFGSGSTQRDCFILKQGGRILDLGYSLDLWKTTMMYLYV